MKLVDQPYGLCDSIIVPPVDIWLGNHVADTEVEKRSLVDVGQPSNPGQDWIRTSI